MGGRDYYGALGISRSATPSEVRAGYRWAAMKWHPQRNPSAKSEAEQRFRDIAEAFDVLLDPERRQRYDEVGEQGLKYPPAGCGVMPYQYVSDPYKLFVDFFASANPLKAAHDLDVKGKAPGCGAREAEVALEVEVECSLAELQDGASKRIVVQRTRLGPHGDPYVESKPVTLPVRAGWASGTKVTFAGEGHQNTSAKQPGDLVFIIRSQAFPPRDPREASLQSAAAA